MMRKILTTIALTVFAVSMFNTVASATKPNPDHKVTICHAVNGEGETKNGYNIITVDVASILKEGHDEHSKTKDGVTHYDIIPAFVYTDVESVEHSYPGKGDASWIATGCAAPVVTTVPPTTEGPTTIVVVPSTIAPTTTVVVGTTTPAPTTTQALKTTTLPNTGSTSWPIVLISTILVFGGIAMAKIARKTLDN